MAEWVKLHAKITESEDFAALQAADPNAALLDVRDRLEQWQFPVAIVQFRDGDCETVAVPEAHLTDITWLDPGGQQCCPGAAGRSGAPPRADRGSGRPAPGAASRTAGGTGAAELVATAVRCIPGR